MIQINLLPYRAARKKENIRKQVSVFFLTIILVVLILFVFDFRARMKITKLENKVKASQTELAKLKKKAKQVDILRKELDSLNNKLKIIESLKQGRKFAVNILKEFTEVTVPERMWLVICNIDKTSIYFEGLALDDRTVADFMRNLENSALMTDVELKGITSIRLKDVDLRKFVISVKVEK